MDGHVGVGLSRPKVFRRTSTSCQCFWSADFIKWCHNARPLTSSSILLQEAAHGIDESVDLVLVEGVEPVLHRAESKRIKGQAREVFGRVSDKVWTSASPFHGQLLGNVMHIVEHIADRPISDLLQGRMYVL